MTPHAAGVVREQMNGHRRVRRRGADPVDVVARRDERVEVAGLEPASLDQPQTGAAIALEDLLVLRSAVQTDEAPREVVVHRRLRLGGNDEAEQRERAVARSVEQPLADPTTHPTLGCGLLILRRQPAGIGEEPSELRPDQLNGLAGRPRRSDHPPNRIEERPDDGSVEDELVQLATPPAPSSCPRRRAARRGPRPPRCRAPPPAPRAAPARTWAA